MGVAKVATSNSSLPLNASLAFALCYVALWWLVMLVLYKRKIFIKA